MGFYERAVAMERREKYTQAFVIMAEGLKRNPDHADALEEILQVYIHKIQNPGFERDLLAVLDAQATGFDILELILAELVESDNQAKIYALKEARERSGFLREATKPEEPVKSFVPQQKSSHLSGQHSLSQRSISQHSHSQHSQHSTPQHSTPQHSPPQHSPPQHSTPQHSHSPPKYTSPVVSPPKYPQTASNDSWDTFSDPNTSNSSEMHAREKNVPLTTNQPSSHPLENKQEHLHQKAPPKNQDQENQRFTKNLARGEFSSLSLVISIIALILSIISLIISLTSSTSETPSGFEAEFIEPNNGSNELSPQETNSSIRQLPSRSHDTVNSDETTDQLEEH